MTNPLAQDVGVGVGQLAVGRHLGFVFLTQPPPSAGWSRDGRAARRLRPDWLPRFPRPNRAAVPPSAASRHDSERSGRPTAGGPSIRRRPLAPCRRGNRPAFSGLGGAATKIPPGPHSLRPHRVGPRHAAERVSRSVRTQHFSQLVCRAEGIEISDNRRNPIEPIVRAG